MSSPTVFEEIKAAAYKHITSIPPLTYAKTIVIFAFVVWLRRSEMPGKYKFMISLGISALIFSYSRFAEAQNEGPKPIVLNKNDMINDFTDPGSQDIYTESMERFQGFQSIDIPKVIRNAGNRVRGALFGPVVPLSGGDRTDPLFDTNDYSEPAPAHPDDSNPDPSDARNGESWTDGFEQPIPEQNIEHFADTPAPDSSSKATDPVLAVPVVNHEPFLIPKENTLDIAQPENYIELKDLVLGSNYTVEFWVRLDCVGNSNRTLWTVFAPTGEKTLDISYEKYPEEPDRVYLIIQDRTLPIKRAEWTHIALVRGRAADGPGVVASKQGGTVYIDGVFANTIYNLPDFERFPVGRSYLFKGPCCEKKTYNQSISTLSNLSVFTLWNRSLSTLETQSLYISSRDRFQSALPVSKKNALPIVSDSVVFSLDAWNEKRMTELLRSKITVSMPWNEVQADILRLRDSHIQYPEEVKTPLDKELYLRWRQSEEERAKKGNWLQQIVQESVQSVGDTVQEWQRVFDQYRVKNMVGTENKPLTVQAQFK